MGSIMIRCQATGRPIATGMRADRASFAQTPVFFARAFCPHCRAQHEWFATEAWVEEEAGDPRRAA